MALGASPSSSHSVSSAFRRLLRPLRPTCLPPPQPSPVPGFGRLAGIPGPASPVWVLNYPRVVPNCSALQFIFTSYFLILLPPGLYQRSISFFFFFLAVFVISVYSARALSVLLCLNYEPRRPHSPLPNCKGSLSKSENIFCQQFKEQFSYHYLVFMTEGLIWVKHEVVL